MTIDDKQLAEALMMQGCYRVGEDSPLGVVAVVDSELQVALTGVLCSHCHRRQHHDTDAVVVESMSGSIDCHIVGQDGIG